MGIRLTEPEDHNDSSTSHALPRGASGRARGSLIARGGVLLRAGVVRLANILRAKKSLPPLDHESRNASGGGDRSGHPLDYIPLNFAATQASTERGFDLWQAGKVRVVDRVAGVYEVEGSGVSFYVVNLRAPRCHCLAFENAPEGRVCKHICAATKAHYEHNPDLYMEV